jgi:hypothetical protein
MTFLQHYLWRNDMQYNDTQHKNKKNQSKNMFCCVPLSLSRSQWEDSNQYLGNIGQVFHHCAVGGTTKPTLILKIRQKIILISD